MSELPRPIDPAEIARQQDAVRSLARQLVRDGGTAEDVAQEAWLVALEGARRGDVPLRWWIRGIVRNVARHFRRADARRQRHESSAAAMRAEAGPDAGSPVERAEVQRRVLDAVLALDEPYRGTVLLRHLHGLSSADIARRQGVPPGTVRSRLKRGLDLLRERLDATHGGDRRAWAVALGPFWFHGGPRAPVTTLAPVPVVAQAAAGFAAAIVAVLAALTTTGVSTSRGRTSPASPPHTAGLGPAADAGVPDDDAATVPSARRRVRSRAASDKTFATPAPVATTTDIRGIVVFADGTPASGARVRVVAEDDPPPPRDGAPPARGVRSAADGTFSAAHGPCGPACRCVLVAETEGHSGGTRVRGSGDARIALAPTSPWRFRVVDPVDAAIPTATARIVLDGADGAAWPAGAADADGRIVLHVGARGRVVVRAPGFGQAAVDPRDAPRRVELRRVASIAGRVVDTAGRLVADATVAVADNRVATPDGTFRMESVALEEWPDVFELFVTAPGFCDSETTAMPGDEDVVVRMVRPRDVRVTVRRPDGSVADGASLDLDGSWTVTGGAGRFTLLGVRPGTFVLRAEWTAVNATAASSALVGETQIDLPEGDGAFDAAVDLAPPPVSWVSALVVDTHGAPQAGITVTADADTMERRPKATGVTDDSGRAVIALCAVPGTLVATHAVAAGRREGPVPRSAWIDTATSAAADGPTHVLTLLPVVNVVLDVTDADGDALPAGTRITVKPHLGSQRATTDGTPAVVAIAGDWVLARVHAEAFAPHRVECIAPAEGSLRVPVRLDRACTVRGRVVDQRGTPAPGANVSVRAPPDWRDAAEWKQVRNVGDDARFVVAGVAPGAMRIVCWRRSGAIEATLDLTLAPGEDRDVGDVVLAGLVWVRGVVKDADGRPVGRAAVSALREGAPRDGDEHLAPMVVTSRDGRFEAALAAGARGLLVARRAGHGAVALPLDVGDGREGLELRLAREARLRVHIDANAAPQRWGERFVVAGGNGIAWEPAEEEAPPRTLLPDGRTRHTFILCGLPAGALRLRVEWERAEHELDLYLKEGETAEARVVAE